VNNSRYFPRINFLLLGVFLLLLADPVHAGVFNRDWVDDEINTVKNQVSDVFGKTGPIHSRIVDMKPKVDQMRLILDDLNPNLAGNFAERFKSQLAELNDKGQLLKETIKDILVWLKTRQGPYVDFVGDLNDKCGTGSPCEQFRADLRNFIQEMGALSDRFPIIAETGLDKTSDIISKFVDLPPPVVMWAFYESWQRAPILQQLPMELELIFDELNDPELFSLNLAGAHNFILSKPQLSLAKFRQVAATDRFCDRSINQNSWDPIRLNRILFVLGYLKTGLGFTVDTLHDDLNLSLVGEGSATPGGNPLAFYLGLVKTVIEIIELAIETRFNNLEICNNLRGANNGGATTGGGNGNGGGGNGGGNGNNNPSPAYLELDGNIGMKGQWMFINIIQQEISNHTEHRAYGQVAERVSLKIGE